jgi:hypothetical protein
VLYVPRSTQTVPDAVKVVAISIAVLSIGFLIYRQLKGKPELGQKGKALTNKAKKIVKESLRRASPSKAFS